MSYFRHGIVKLFLWSLSIRDLDELLGDIQHDGLEVSNEEANHSDGSNNNHIQATIEGMQR